MTTLPTFPDGPPAPLLVEGLVNRSTLEQMFSDLAAFADLTDVREKGGVATYSGSGPESLEATLRGLLAGTARAVQLRYRFDGHDWTDTILTAPAGFRVVRCRHDP